jgi:hypothetical protein
MKTVREIGAVAVDVGDPACTVPYAPASIEKVQKSGTRCVRRPDWPRQDT